MKKLLIIILFSMTFMLLNAQSKKDSRIAIMHYMDKNYVESFKDYIKLAKFLNPDDLGILARHYHYGLGTAKNIEKAKEYYKLAAEKGDKISQSELCVLNYDDEEIDNIQQRKDLYKYSRMFSTNFELDGSTGLVEDKSRYALYLCYKNGWGTEKNKVLAEMWLAFAAFNDAMYAQDEFCEIYHIDGDYDSEEEEAALQKTYFQHIYKTISEYIKDDNSVESEFFKMYYDIISETPSLVKEGYKKLFDLYENPDVPKEGKAVLFDYISQIAQSNKDISEKYKDVSEEYQLISDEKKNTWIHIQFTKLMWKIDTKLNKSIISTGKANNHEWIDLGLPSGRKWATCNIGSSKPTEGGTLFAWAETKTKSKFKSANYKAKQNMYIIDSTADAARTNYGSSWTIPSCEDWRELFMYCDIKYDQLARCIIAISPNGQTLKLPFVKDSEEGYTYWTNTRVSSMWDPEEGSAISLIINKLPNWNFIYTETWVGSQIRPVIK